MRNYFKLLLALSPLFFVFSCKNSFDLVKRHYNKGFYVAHSHSPKIERREAPENAEKPVAKTGDYHSREMIAEKENAQAESKLSNERKEEKIVLEEKVTARKEKSNTANETVKPGFVASGKPIDKKEKNQEDLPVSGAMSEGAKLFLFILLALVLPPLAIYIWQDKITKWFWITVVLCALSYFGTYIGPVFGLWFAAFIIALLIILEVIS